jgi:hypothetical protein
MWNSVATLASFGPGVPKKVRAAVALLGLRHASVLDRVGLQRGPDQMQCFFRRERIYLQALQ